MMVLKSPTTTPLFLYYIGQCLSSAKFAFLVTPYSSMELFLGKLHISDWFSRKLRLLSPEGVS